MEKFIESLFPSLHRLLKEITIVTANLSIVKTDTIGRFILNNVTASIFTNRYKPCSNVNQLIFITLFN